LVHHLLGILAQDADLIASTFHLPQNDNNCNITSQKNVGKQIHQLKNKRAFCKKKTHQNKS